MVLLWFCDGFDMVLVCFGMVLVLFWYGLGMFWYGVGMVLVWFLNSCGMVLVWFWYSFGMVWVWFCYRKHASGSAYAVFGIINPIIFPNCSGSFPEAFWKIVGRGCGLEAESPMRPSGPIAILVWF